LKRFILWYFIFSVWIYALPPGVEQEIQKSGIAKKDISIYIKELGYRNSVIASLNATRTRTPASVIKVLTIYASILKLGFDYRWPTQFYRNGSLSGGVLDGDLVIKGFGDPTLSIDELEDIVQRIRAQDITRITGDIIIDRSYFKVGTKNSSGFDAHPYSPYNAMPDAMMFNERVSTICVVPKQNNVTKETVDHSYSVLNQLKTVNKPCRGRYSWPAVKIDNTQVIPVVLLKGKISKRCGKRKICKVLTKPYRSFYYALKDALVQSGVEVQGTLHLRKVPTDARILFTHYSQPLEKIVSETAKKSNNLYARHLLLMLGARQYGAPATISKGRKAVVQILRNRGALGAGALKIDNGSGLSRSSRINAKILAELFENAYRHYGQRWMKTLSIAGVDGTIKKRFRGTIVRKRAWMKTGTLKHVKNIGGYVKSRSGRLYTVVILINTKKGRWKAAKLQDNIIQWLVRYNGGTVQKSIRQKPVAKKESGVMKTKPPQKKAKHVQKYYIQAGRFSRFPDQGYLSKIENLGLRYTVRHETQYRVLIGVYKNKQSAKKELQKVRKLINAGAFVVKL